MKNMRNFYHTLLFRVAFFYAFISCKKRGIIPVEMTFFFFIIITSVVEASSEIVFT